jgi:hypothetical protein
MLFLSEETYMRNNLARQEDAGRLREISDVDDLLADGRFSSPPIIIGGCGRSGTSLLLSILAAHPHIIGIPHETTAFCPKAYTAVRDLDAPFETKRITEYLSAAEIPPGVTRWCEKTPKNILVFGRLLDAFGDRVRLINIVRDGRDVITSRHRGRPNRLYVSVDRWATNVKAGLPFDFHPQVLVVKYEDLIMRFEQSVARIMLFLDEQLESRVLDWHANTTVRTHPAWKGHVASLHTNSIGRWREACYKDVVSWMMGDPEAVYLLKHYGYLDRRAQPTGVWTLSNVLRRMKRRVPPKVKHIFRFLSKARYQRVPADR